MFKELQKQIEEKKRELIKPLKEEIEGIFKGFKIEIDFDLEKSSAILAATKEENNSFINLSFFLEGETRAYTNLAVKHEIENGILMAVKPVPFSIDLSVLNFVFYKLGDLIKSLDPQPQPEEEE